MLNESVISIRVKLQKAGIKKSGKNDYARFSYYELSDFLPKLNELMLEENINDIFSIKDDVASLTLIKGEERQVYEIPFVLFSTPENVRVDNKTGEVKTTKSMQDIQYLGALNTYYKRYLYLNAFGITDGEIIDTMDNNNIQEKKEPLATQKQIEKIKELVNDIDSMLKYYHVGKIEDLSLMQASEIIAKKGGKK